MCFVIWIYRFNNLPEACTMIHFFGVRKFVRNNVIYKFKRQFHQCDIKGDPAIVSAAAPSTTSVRKFYIAIRKTMLFGNIV